MSYSIKNSYKSHYKENYTLYNTHKVGLLTFNAGGASVPKTSYYFIPEGDFVTDLTFETKNLYETVTNKGGGFNPLKSLSSGVASLSGSDQFASRYINLPEQVSFNVGITGSIKLKFVYGLQDVYNAKIEVVNPILEIIQMYFPAYKDNKVTGPYASSGRILIDMLRNISKALEGKTSLTGTGTEGGSTSGGSDDGANIVEQLNKVGSAIVNSFDSLVNKVYFKGELSDSETAENKKMLEEYETSKGEAPKPNLNEGSILKTCNIEIGNIRYQYLFTTGVSWGFITDNVDQNGYPMEGFVELKNPSFVMLPAVGDSYSFINSKTTPIQFGGTPEA
jgi:hypothetical protein